MDLLVCGAVVDEQALVQALDNGHLAGAGIDVTEVEPLAEDSPLWGRDNVVVGNWPVVEIIGGKTRIQEFGSIVDWLDKHSDVLVKYMKSHGLRTAS